MSKFDVKGDSEKSNPKHSTIMAEEADDSRYHVVADPANFD
ncbi:hypothetical protein [Desulforhopalus sp. IMCC35007]|nr:hypothetical protein [Desulforhopalus sp. IMCC35007]